MRHRTPMCAFLGAFAALAVFASSASAALQPGTFSCRASPLRVTSPILNAEPEVANPQNAPCANDFAQLAHLSLPPLLSVGLLQALTQNNPQGVPGARSTSAVGNIGITLGTTTIGAQALTAQASAHCVGPTAGSSNPELAGSSKVVGLTINGTTVLNFSGPLTIPLDGLLTLYLNRKIHVGNTIIQRALEISSPALHTDIVAGEAVADVEGCGV